MALDATASPAVASATGVDAWDQTRRACVRLRERLGADRVVLWILDHASGTVAPMVAERQPTSAGAEVADRWAGAPLDDIPFVATALTEQRPVVVDDPSRHGEVPARLVTELDLGALRVEPIVAERTVGAVMIEPAGAAPTGDVEDLLQLLAVSVSQVTARREAEQQREQAALLLELVEADAGSESLSQTLGELCQRLARHARMRRACLFLLEEGRLLPRMARYADGHEDPQAWERFRSATEPLSITEAVLASGRPQVAESTDSPLVNDWWATTFGLGSIVAVPVGAPPNLAGVLTLDDPQPRRFPPELVRLVAAAAGRVDGIIARAKADEERAWHLRTVKALRDLLQDASQAASVADTGQVLAEVAARVFEADHAVFVRQRHGSVVDVVPVGVEHEHASTMRRELIGTKLAAYGTWQATLQQSEPAFVVDDEGDVPAVLRTGTPRQACAVLPLASSEETLGLVHVSSSGRRRWRRRQVALAEQLSLEARLVVDNALLREKERQRLSELAHHATHDALTGLPNRALLEDRMAQALRQRLPDPARIALLFVDLDRFKRINDRSGHAVADELLCEVANRLRDCVRAEDTVARFAGDEFVVLLTEVDEPDGAERVAERIRRRLAAPVTVEDGEIFATASIGIAYGHPGQTDPDWLLRAADAAMYRVKRTGRGRWAVFDPDQDVVSEGSLGLEADLHYALDRGELSLRYQPIVDLAEGRADGFEVLLRWEHPEHGLIPPLDFIPLAEATGMIEPIGRWVIDQACQQLAAWREGHGRRDLFVSVNLSPTQVHDPRLVTHVKQALDRSGLPPEALMLELTESSLMQEDEGLTILTELHRLGVKLAIDDFGTGYSALSYLQRFPIDVLKVDKSFVSSLGQGPREGSLARTVVAIARSIGVLSVAEGIETRDQLDELRTLGSRLGQGYHFAAPLVAEDAVVWLRTVPA